MNDSAVVGAAGKGLMGLLISLAVGLSACTSEYHEFCETLVICHESAVGSSIEDCELTFQNEESEDPLERQMCQAQLAEAAGANHCGTFSDIDLCALCDRRTMSRVVNADRNLCGLSPFAR